MYFIASESLIKAIEQMIWLASILTATGQVNKHSNMPKMVIFSLGKTKNSINIVFPKRRPSAVLL